LQNTSTALCQSLNLVQEEVTGYLVVVDHLSLFSIITLALPSCYAYGSKASKYLKFLYYNQFQVFICGVL